LFTLMCRCYQAV